MTPFPDSRESTQAFACLQNLIADMVLAWMMLSSGLIQDLHQPKHKFVLGLCQQNLQRDWVLTHQKQMCQESWDWPYWVTLWPAVHSNSALVLQHSYCRFFHKITFQSRFWYMGGHVRKIGWSCYKGQRLRLGGITRAPANTTPS